MSTLPGPFGLRTAPLAAADSGALLALLRANAAYSRLSTGREALPTDADEILRARPRGAPPQAKQVLGFWDGGALAAVCDLLDGYPDADTLFIGLLMVDAARQGAGLGAAVLQHVAGQAAARGHTRLRLAVIEANTRALRFWEKQGFAATGRQVVAGDGSHPAWPVVVMEQKISPPA